MGKSPPIKPHQEVRVGLDPDAPDMTPAEIEHYRDPEAVVALEEAVAQIRSGQGHHGAPDDLRRAWEERHRTQPKPSPEFHLVVLSQSDQSSSGPQSAILAKVSSSSVIGYANHA